MFVRILISIVGILIIYLFYSTTTFLSLFGFLMGVGGKRDEKAVVPSMLLLLRRCTLTPNKLSHRWNPSPDCCVGVIIPTAQEVFAAKEIMRKRI
jgi:hypothetical protein